MRCPLYLSVLVLLASACSTTRVLEEGQYRLAHNDITIKGPFRFSQDEISPYIRQNAQDWNPFICVYNWSLKDGFWHKLGKAPLVYNPEDTEISCQNIANRMEYLGYYDSKVYSEIKYKDKKARVNYVIEPGKSYRITSVKYEIPEEKDFKADFIADTLVSSNALRGQWLSEFLLEDESVRSAGRLRNLGYFDFGKTNYSFEADTLSNGTASIIYRVRNYTRNETEAASRPLRRYYIDSIHITHPTNIKIKEKLLTGLNTLKPGELYNEQNVNNTYSRFSAIKLFSGVQVQMTPSDYDKVNCEIALSPSPVRGVKVKLEGSSNSTGLLSTSPQISFHHKNIFHGGEWFNLAFSGDFQYRPSDQTKAIEYGISAGLSFPKLIFVPYSSFKGSNIPRTEINAAWNWQNRPEYNRAVASLALGISGITKKNTSYQIHPLRVNFVRLFNLDPKFATSLNNNPFIKYSYQDHLDAGIGVNFYYNSSSDIVPQGSYMFRRISLDLSGNSLSLFKKWMPQNSNGQAYLLGSPYSQYVHGEYSWGRNWSYGPDNNQGIAVRLLAGAGYAYGNSTMLPFEKRFYAGGASSMRGWQARALGPGGEAPSETFIIPSQTGDLKLEANMEYRFSLFRFKNGTMRLEGVLFSDVGNVWNLTDDNSDGAFRIKDFYKTIAADWGMGLRLNLQFILIRVDFGMQVYDPSLKEGSRLINPRSWIKGNNACHFGVGYPF